MSFLNKVYISWWKDFYIEKSYPIRFVILFSQLFLQLLLIFYISKFIGLPENELDFKVVDLLGFLVIGIFILDMSNFMISYPAIQIEQYKMSGVFEELFVLPTQNSHLVLLSHAYPVFISLIKTFIYISFLFLMFEGVNISFLDILYFFASIFLALVLFIGISLIASGMSILFFKGSWIATINNTISIIFGGVFFPPALIGNNFASFANLIPIHNIVEILRYIFDITEATSAPINDLIIYLILQSLIFFGVGWFFLKFAIKKSFLDGNIPFH